MKIITYITENGEIEASYERSLHNIFGKADSSANFCIVEADEQLTRLLDDWDGREYLIGRLLNYFEGKPDVRLLISATGSDKYRNYCLKEARLARWGCCFAGYIAIEYAPMKERLMTQLHESLHLFGVDDCYKTSDLHPKDSCTDDSCFMRYGVHSSRVCKSALEQIKDFITETNERMN